MLIGYARVSTADQDAALQRDALKREGCERIFEETASGGKADRPQLARALDHMRSGDTDLRRKGKSGEPRWIRTIDPLIKSQMLYRLSYGLPNGIATWATCCGCFRKDHKWTDIIGQ